MVFRKPYAFLIKNFKRIHIVLIALALFLSFNISKISTFIRDFMSTYTYNEDYESISRYVNFSSLFICLLITVILLILIILLRHKAKPWKLYLVPFICYFIYFFGLIGLNNYFGSFQATSDTTGIRLLRDIVFASNILQYPSFIIFIIRAIGLDLKKFSFNQDEEFLDLSQEDREELEIKFNIDRHVIIRFIKKIIRNIKYFYLEHKFIIYMSILGVVIIIFGSLYNYFFIINKGYKDNELLITNGYEIKINDCYYTNKNYRGEIISSKSNFIILNLNVKNNSKRRKLNLNKFVVMSGNKTYSNNGRTYSEAFHDLGTVFDAVEEIDTNEIKNALIIFKVDNNIKKDRLALYFQDNDISRIKKVKINIKDISNIEKQKEIKKGEALKFTYKRNEEKIIIDDVNIGDTFTYVSSVCSSSSYGCEASSSDVVAKNNKKILKLDFSSIDFNGKDFVDFLTLYGRIDYIDNNSKRNSIDIEDAVGVRYYGKEVYLSIPSELESAKKVYLNLTIRDKNYLYRII